MSDMMVRATAAGAQLRAFVLTSGDLVEAARQAHDLSPVASAALGRLLTAGVMMGATLKGEKDLLTVRVKGDGPIGGITVTADSTGRVKGYVDQPGVLLPPSRAGKLDVGGAVGRGWLQVVKDMGLKEPYIGRIELQTGEIADDLTYYFATSEQVPSTVGLGVLMERENRVRCAGGFIIQLMPFAEEGVVAELEERLRGVRSVTEILEENNSPEFLLERLLGGMDPVINERMRPEFYCNCDKRRVEKALIGIGRKGIEELIAEGESVELKCHFCNRGYDFTVEELRGILMKAASTSGEKKQ
ncbi:MAG: Hsp33 family molecular chaperone HslO [Lachnospiraceae bacterium]|jgi:molecular chaperone Hsp33|nr:Hsp33 family molecular chaperone HslO [Lachnospiraceae bacterium]